MITPLRWYARAIPLLVAAANLIRIGPHLIDDAFISFRFSANAAAGHGFVFNPGERVEGFSNLLWTVLLAGAARVGLPLPETALVLGALCFMCALWLIVEVTHRLTESTLAAIVVGILVATSTNIVGSSLLGLEAPLAMLGLALVLRGAVDERDQGATLSIAAGGLIVGTARAEGILLGPLLLAMGLLTRRSARRPLLIALGMLVTVKLIERGYYGHWLPMSVLAKRDLDGSIWTSLWRNAATGETYVEEALGLGWLVAILLSLVSLLRATPAVRRFAPFALLPFVFGVTVCVSNRGDWMPFARLLTPYLPGIITLAAGALWSATPWKALLPAWAALMLIVEPRPATAAIPAAQALEDVGRILERTARPGEVNELGALGRVGYYAPSAYISDLFGLTEPAIALQPTAGTIFGKESFRYSAGLRPTFILHNYWPSLAGVLKGTREPYTILTSDELVREHVFIAVRSDAVDRFLPPLRDRFGAQAHPASEGIALWTAAGPSAR